MNGVIDVVFWVVSALAIGSALLVVTLRDLFRAALALAGSFLAAAVIFFLLQAEFLGVAQILVYVGAISVIIVFAILLTREVSTGSLPHPSRTVIFGAGFVSVLLVLLVGFVAYQTDWRERGEITDPDVAAALTGTYAERTITVNGEQRTVLVEVPRDAPDARPGVFTDSTSWIGRLLIRDYVLALQIIGLVLLGSLIGAIALVRDARQEVAGEGTGE